MKTNNKNKRIQLYKYKNLISQLVQYVIKINSLYLFFENVSLIYAYYILVNYKNFSKINSFYEESKIFLNNN